MYEANGAGRASQQVILTVTNVPPVTGDRYPLGQLNGLAAAALLLGCALLLNQEALSENRAESVGPLKDK